MDKSKSEKLKEVLNQTLSSEEIEKKLKEEIKQSAIKKKQEESEKEKQRLKEEHEQKTKEALENLETSVEKEIHQEENKYEREENLKKEKNPLEEKIVIPTIRDKKKESKNINTLLSLVIIIVLLLLTIVFYLFTKEEKIEIKSQKPKIEKKEIIDIQKNSTTITNDKSEEKKLLIIDETKNNKKEEEKEEPLNIEKSIPNNKAKTQIEKNSIKDEKPEIQIKEIIKEKIVEKEIKLNKENFKKYYNSSKYNSLKCYNFKAGDIFPDSICKNDLRKFLKENKDAIRFEIIPVIAQDDNQIFDKMKDNIKQMDKTFQDRVKEYMFRGLSRERVLETSWQIKDFLGDDTVLTPTNYYVKSKKNNKGIIVKAYH